MIESKNHDLHTVNTTKISLYGYSDKLFIHENGIDASFYYGNRSN